MEELRGQKICLQIVGPPWEEGQSWLCVASRGQKLQGTCFTQPQIMMQRTKLWSKEPASHWKLSSLEGRDPVHGTHTPPNPQTISVDRVSG